MRPRLSAALLSTTILAACVAEGPQPPPPPRPIPQQPANVKVDRIITSASIPEDTDHNGYLNLISVTVYLFDDTYGLSPIHVPGSMSFRLVDAAGKPVATWSFDEAKTEAARRRFLPGPGYQFQLDLLDVGTDRLPSSDAQLYSTFTPTGGAPVQPRSGITVPIGPTH